MINICAITCTDQSLICILNITALLILVWFSQYVVSKISPACNLKIIESPKTNLLCFLAINSTFYKNVMTPKPIVWMFELLSWVLFSKKLSLHFTIKCWHVICNLEVCISCFHYFWQKNRKTSKSLLKH